MTSKKHIIIGITGASGAIYGIRALEALQQDPEIRTHLVISEAAKITIKAETNWKVSDVEALADIVYKTHNIGAKIASGSFLTSGMLVAPCSIKTLSAIANSYTSELISRSVDVQLKEGRQVVLMVRETPLHKGQIRLMLKAADNGAIIMPPVPMFYNRPGSIDEMVNNTVGRALFRLGIQNTRFDQWGGLGKAN